VKRAIQAELIQQMANNLLRGVFEEDDTIVVSADKDGLALTTGPKIVRDVPVMDDEEADAAHAKSTMKSYGGAAAGGGGFL
jgi:hypothetical protein